MAKFCLSTVSDFGAEVLNERVRQALHRSQTNLRSSSPRTSVLRGNGILNTVDFEVPNADVGRDDIMDWVLEMMRENYAGPPLVIALDLLPEDYVVIPSSPSVPA